MPACHCLDGLDGQSNFQSRSRRGGVCALVRGKATPFVLCVLFSDISLTQ